MKLPTMIPVKSTNVAALGHSPDGLFVQFHKSGVYHYPDVPEMLFQEGLASDSPGSWFAGQIKGSFKGGKLDAQSDD